MGKKQPWPAPLPRKGTKSRKVLTRLLKGATADELVEEGLVKSASELGGIINTLRDQKGVDIRSLKRRGRATIYMAVGLMRPDNSYFSIPGSKKAVEKVLTGRVFTERELRELNEYQASGVGHVFTCPHREEGTHNTALFGDLGALVATRIGLVCPSCGYTQEKIHWQGYKQFIGDKNGLE